MTSMACLCLCCCCLVVCSPLHNLLALWVLSHACLYPGHWLLAISLLLTAVLLWRITIQVGARLRVWCASLPLR